FFSSRRRHTRFSRDWSSDVCSSDLLDASQVTASIGRLLVTDRETMLGKLSDVMVDDSHFNKFAICVPPALRRLHLASTVAAPSELGRASCRESVGVSVDAAD